ncbi:arginyltransferase [Rhodothalassium salexigens]|uniref:Aspartate/glutamate leucyltransferase n=1 Tax=Rhodothalassium salexigens DSM 2132 TaxID=1188247 RepID=A0A4R2PWC5_RHOSA|nr:arginyltransferase [Rhodothalassium salexigens]MBB4210287.1 arginine-tRNA-protein transferase [Rhodothalassium salexigens DSM 2132]MBK1639196.1 arginyltransferase [Rhodothalassium salexigens DSM 2132]MBK5911718.1 arginyltransferase [Rhodothalassium salexigens]MBK5920495.1 arginyltransferase [Rhodothalassium salexigens]TCP38451.1 arginine-tRNA-protein transferase [Rhodothalassium salexigens DSM 2132]
MTDQSLQFPRFYVTTPAPCPYLAGREERKVFTELHGDDAESLNEALSRVGFRRSQSVAYRPACEGCSACISVRVVAPEFRPNRSMRKVARRCGDLSRTLVAPRVSEEQYDLLKRYLETRHGDGGMAEMNYQEFADMAENSPVRTAMIEYRDPAAEGALVGAALTDVMADGLSMVYSFFDPASDRPSLGTHMIMDHIAIAQEMGLRNVYLGYWIAESRKMAYKARYRPLERLGPDGWYRFDPDRPDPSAGRRGTLPDRLSPSDDPGSVASRIARSQYRTP